MAAEVDDAIPEGDGAHAARGALGAMDPVPGLVWGYALRGPLCEEIDPAELTDWLANPDSAADGTWAWLHFDLSDRRTPATLARLLGEDCASGPVPPALIDAFAVPGDTPELHFTQGFVQGSLRDHVIDIDGVRAEQGLLHIVVGPALVLTGRRLHLQSVEAARQLARDASLGTHPMRLLETLARLGTDEHVDALDDMSATLDQIEDHVLSESGAIERSRIIRIRHALVRLHRELAGMLRLFERVDQEVREETGRLAPTHAGAASAGVDHWADFGVLLQHLHGLDDLCLSLLDRARLLQEEASDQLASQTNRQLYVLSILTAALGPPTIVVGVFGMNTGGLPLTSAPMGTGIALALCVLSSFLVVGVLALTGLITRPDWSREAEVPVPRGRAARRRRSSGEAHRGDPAPAPRRTGNYLLTSIRRDGHDRLS